MTTRRDRPRGTQTTPAAPLRLVPSLGWAAASHGPADDDASPEQPPDDMGLYRLGRQYATAITDALHSAISHSPAATTDALQIADALLGPIGDISDPDSLRNFIAGLANQFESQTATALRVSSPSP